MIWIEMVAANRFYTMMIRCKISIILSMLLTAWPLSAQMPDTLLRRGSNLVDGSGTILTDAEVLDLVGDPIYSESYLGAKKDYQTGRALIWSGAAGMVVGLVSIPVGYYFTARGIFTIEPSAIFGGMVAFYGGIILASGGCVVLCGGIPLSIQGKKGLNRVADEYNAGRNLTYNVGATPNGVGIVLRF